MKTVAKMFVTFTLAAMLVSSTNGAAVNNNLERACVCTREFNPYCGSNGVTYSNECLFNCAKQKHPELQLHHYGDCEDELNNDACICTLEYNAVCGSDGETYPNKCSLECRQKKSEGLKIAYEGECEGKVSKKVEGCKCSREYLPICGTDYQTYDNECQLDCQRKKTPELSVKFHGRCDESETFGMLPIDEDDCVCNRIFEPVCGSDGKTYSNDCRFNCQQNKYSYLKIAHRGECKSGETEPECICTLEYTPVCGSNRKTYSNECELNCEQQMDAKLELESEGPCKFAVPYWNKI